MLVDMNSSLSEEDEHNCSLTISDDGGGTDGYKQDTVWMECLLKLQKKSIIVQHLLACFSTLGGAYHLCDHPYQAMVIARQTFFIGKYANDDSVMIRSRVFVAINAFLLGKKKQSKRIMNDCITTSRSRGWEHILSFCEASQGWLDRKEIAIANEIANEHTCTSKCV